MLSNWTRWRGCGIYAVKYALTTGSSVSERRLTRLYLSVLLDAGGDHFSAPSSVGCAVIRFLRNLTSACRVGKLLLCDSFFTFFFLLFFALGH